MEEIENEELRKKQEVANLKRREEEELKRRQEPQYPRDVSPAYVPSESEIQQSTSSPSDYVPGSPSDYVPRSPSDYVPSSLNNDDEYDYGGGSSQTVNDFALGDQVYFTRSVDLGLQQNHIWRVAKKGGTLLTLTTDRGSIIGGASTNLTKSDLVQIAKADELIRPDAFMRWEEQRAGALLAQQRRQYMMGGHMMDGQPMPMQQPQVPQINIKMVGGNDFSRGGEGENDGPTKIPGQGQDVNIAGGSDQNAFNNLVIPNSAKKESNPPEKTIMGGLADFGSLVINKIM